jgi:hypothetical protein
MAETSIPFGSPQAAKVFGAGLFAFQQKTSMVKRLLTAPTPTEAATASKLEGQQTAPGMPIVEVMDLTKTAGDRAQLDCVDIVTAYPIMGDRNAEGRGSPMSFSNMDIEIDQWTFPLAAGGKMSQQRSPYNLRKLARSQALGLVNRYHDQGAIIHLSGARGTEDGADWVIPQASHPEFSDILINDLLPPTANRYFAVSGSDLVQDVTHVGALASTDDLNLGILDQTRGWLDSLAFGLQSVRIPGDEAADDPMWLFLAPGPVYASLLAEGQVRAFQQNAINRANFGAKHPLFMGEVGMWNGQLTRKLQRFVSFGNGDTVSVTKADGTIQSVTVSGLPNGHRLYRCLLLGAQALGIGYGKDSASGTHYSWSEVLLDHGRKPEFACYGIEGKKKVRFSVPDVNGNKVVTDFGVVVIDVVAKAPINS